MNQSTNLPTPERLQKIKEQRKKRLNTPQPKRTYSSGQLAIKDHSSQIEEISASNAQLHAQNVKLRHELNSITKALDKNIDFLTESCRSQQSQNLILKDSISSAHGMMNSIQELLNQCSTAGIDVSKIPDLNHEVLSLIFEIQPPSNPDETMDPFVKTICNQNHLFFGCTTNDQFVNRCISYKREMLQPQNYRPVRVPGKTKEERIESLKKILYKMQLQNAENHAILGKQINSLQHSLYD